MIRDITIGQYYPAESLIHRLDPRVKLTCTFIFIISLFVANNPWAYLWAAVVLTGIIASSRVPFKFMIKGLKAVLILIIFTVAFNMFLTPGHTIFQFFIFKITEEGLVRAGMMGIRLVFLIIGSSVMTLTTTPNDLTDGIESLLKPLNKIGVPVHEIAMMMTIALRFIPILLEETDKIMKAQMARGAELDSGNIIQKAKNMIPILVPLFISAFRRANDLAMAMEARCYRGGEGRTKMKPLRYKSRDHMAYAAAIVYLGIMIVIRRFL